MKLPHVLHIGYSKAMSTWLQALFKAQESLYVVQKTSFFSPHHEAWNWNLAHYSRQFEKARDDQVIIESDEHILLPGVHPRLAVSTTNLEQIDVVCSKIEASCPGVRIIVVVRNQADLLLSRYIQYVRGQGGHISGRAFLEQLVFDDNYKRYMDYRYSLVYALLQSRFGKDHVLLLRHENAVKDKGTFLSDLGNFIGVPLSEPVSIKNGLNVSPSYSCLRVQRAINRGLLVGKTDRTAIGERQVRSALYAGAVAEKLDRLLRVKRNRHLIFSDDLIRSIDDIYRPDNVQFERMMGRGEQ